jgi:hypothetical protein
MLMSTQTESWFGASEVVFQWEGGAVRYLGRLLESVVRTKIEARIYSDSN